MALWLAFCLMGLSGAVGFMACALLVVSHEGREGE